MKRILNFTSRQSGFTLIEIMVAIAVMAIVFGVIASAVGIVARNGRDAKRRADLETVRNGLQQYYLDHQYFPSSGAFAFGGAMSDAGKTYMGRVPDDPTSGSHYCYEPLKNRSGGVCSNVSGSTTKCQYYRLCTNLEGAPPAGSTPCSGACAGNYQVGPD